MPVLRYFVFVGAALLTLLFAVGEVFPALPVTADNTTSTAVNQPTIRIRSDRRWPERVVFDTGAPTIVPAAVVAAGPAPTQSTKNEALNTAPAQGVEAVARVTAQDAFAQLTPSDLKKMGAKPQQKRKIAKKHVTPLPIQVAQRPQLGLFANNIW